MVHLLVANLTTQVAWLSMANADAVYLNLASSEYATDCDVTDVLAASPDAG